MSWSVVGVALFMCCVFCVRMLADKPYTSILKRYYNPMDEGLEEDVPSPVSRFYDPLEGAPVTSQS